MSIDCHRLRGDVEALAAFGATPAGGVDRPTYSPADAEARAWLTGRCAQAGLNLREDGLGNLFARLDPPGGGADRAPVWTGSHLDSVPDGGRFDGAAGVLASLECLRSLREDAGDLARPVELVVFADEEGCYRGLLGSGALAGGLDADELDTIRGRDGRSLREALAASGRDPAAAAVRPVPPGSVHAYLELHIEQGPRLEAGGHDVGIVTTIVGLGHGEMVFRGQADHAGTTPMDRRRDALRGAGAFLAALADVPALLGVSAGVVTCGNVAVRPGADNIVPAEVACRLDFRAPERGDVEELESAIATLGQDCAATHGLEADYTREHLADPAPMDPRVRQALRDAADDVGARHVDLPSGAGHDAQMMARIAPAGMVFAPSVDGRSHCPQERTDWDDLATGAGVLLGALRRLASSPA